jgi:hypothetical protein
MSQLPQWLPFPSDNLYYRVLLLKQVIFCEGIIFSNKSPDYLTEI